MEASEAFAGQDIQPDSDEGAVPSVQDSVGFGGADQLVAAIRAAPPNGGNLGILGERVGELR